MFVCLYDKIQWLSFTIETIISRHDYKPTDQTIIEFNENRIKYSKTVEHGNRANVKSEYTIEISQNVAYSHSDKSNIWMAKMKNCAYKQTIVLIKLLAEFVNTDEFVTFN